MVEHSQLHDTSQQYLISGQEEWRLLLGVCPLFESEIQWVPTNLSGPEEELVEITAGWFRTEIKLIKALVPAEISLSGDDYYQFMRSIKDLLSSLEALLNDAIKTGGCSKSRPDVDTNDESSNQLGNLDEWPKLVALGHLLQNTDNQNTSVQLNQFVRLRQHARVLKGICSNVTEFNKRVSNLSPLQISHGGTQATQSKPSEHRSKISDEYSKQSKRLFESLANHIERCTIENLKHHAMLQLKHTEHQEDQESLQGKVSHPIFCMRFGSCSLGSNWIPTHCTVSTGVNISNECERAVPVTKICESAGYASQNQQIFRLRLTEKQFLDISGDLDVSDDRFILKDPEKSSMVSLKNLLAREILGDRFQFYPSDKKILAYTLAHALMNLHDNPWLQTLWTLDQIFFLQSGRTGLLYNIHQPYVSCVLSTDVPPLETLDRLHTYPLVLSFAKLLWELEMGEELLPRKVNNIDGEQSYWLTLQHFCKTASKHQFSIGYRKALEACVNFPRYVSQEKVKVKDLKTAERQAILKYIVGELESEVDLTLKKEWGTRDLDLNLGMQITAKGQPTQVIASQTILKVPEDVCTRPASLRADERSLRNGDLPKPPQKHLADNSKDIHEEYANNEEQPTSNLSILESISTSGTPITPLIVTNKARSTMPITLKRSLDQFDNSLPRKSAKLSESTTPRSATVEAASKITTPFTGSQGQRWASIAQDVPYRDVAKIQVQDYNVTMGAGFGHMELLSALEPRPEISSKSFSYLNGVVSQHWQHWHKDKPIRVAVLDTGLDLMHEDFQQPRTKTFTGEYKTIAKPEHTEEAQASRVVAWRNFCLDGQATNDVSDVDGHGTQVAGIILRLAPHAHLYVARVCTGDRNRGLSGEQHHRLEQEDCQMPEPNVVKEAVQWAIDNNVQIINLSLGFRKPETSYIRSLREMLQQVQNRRQAVVFAATSNQGAHEPVAWPANSLRCAIGVHSCRDTGREPSHFSADPVKSPDATDFMIVGENILSQWPTAKGGGFRIATGTSFATPVASAIGALVLQFVQQKGCTKHWNRVKNRVPLDDLYANYGMTKVLKAISTKRREGYDAINAKLFWENHLPTHDAMDHAWQIIERALED